MKVSPILPDHLWVGPAPTAGDRAQLAELGVTAVLSVIHPSDRYVVPDALRQHVAWAQLPIRDSYLGGLPTVEDLVQGVEILRQWRRQGHRIYLHCLEGKGRSPLVAMAYLVAANHEEADPLEHRLAAAIARVKQARRIADPNVFQLKVLCEFVIHALDLPQPVPKLTPEELAAGGPMTKVISPGTSPTLFDRFSGAMLGLAVGDALGTTLEFQPPGTFKPLADMVGGGPFNLQPGQWTDDTSMALCLAESLFERHGFDPADQMEHYQRWYREGDWSSTGRCFDIGNTVREALDAYAESRDPFSGPTAPNKAGNGSLMRLAPVPLFYHRLPEQALRFAAESSRTTHGARAAVDACRFYAGLILGALQGRPKDELLSPSYSPVAGALDSLCPEIAAVANGSYKHKAPPQIRGTGYVVQSLEAALWAFHASDSFEAGVLMAVNLGEDADTTGAIFGQLAGAYYGVQGIPQRWNHALAQREDILELIGLLYEGSQHVTEPREGRPPLTLKRAIGVLEAMCQSPEWRRHGHGPDKPLRELLYESQLGSFGEAHFGNELSRLLEGRGDTAMTLHEALRTLQAIRKQPV